MTFCDSFKGDQHMGQEVTMVIVESTSTAIIKKISYDVIDMIALLI